MFSCYIKVKYDNLFRKLPNIQLCCYLRCSVQFWTSRDGSKVPYMFTFCGLPKPGKCWTTWKRSFLLWWSLKAKPNNYILGIWHTKLLRSMGNASLKLPHKKPFWELMIIMLIRRRKWSTDTIKKHYKHHLKRMSEESYMCIVQACWQFIQSMLQIGFASLVVLWVELSLNTYDPPSLFICPIVDKDNNLTRFDLEVHTIVIITKHKTLIKSKNTYHTI